MRQHPPALETVKEYSSMSIYTYESAKRFCEILNIEFQESIAVSDQELDKIPEDSVLGGTDYVSGMIWITDGKENSYIDPRETIPEGWRSGRTIDHMSNRDPEKWSELCKQSANKQWENNTRRKKLASDKIKSIWQNNYNVMAEKARKRKLNEMLLEAKANKAAAAFERMQSSSAVAQKNKQIQQSRENADSASKNQSYNRKSRDANIAARAVQKHSNQGQTQTFWRDEDGIPHVGGGEFAVNMAKAVNLSDRSPNLSEEAPANAMGTAGISGAQTAVDAGIAGYDLPIGMVRRKPPKMFAGKAVFTVPSSDFYNATLGRKKGKHYRSYVKGELGEEVRQYALENKNAPIILEDETTGAMMYLEYGKEK